MKMKKFLAMLTAATVMLGMVSCSDDDDDDSSKSKKNKNENSASTVDDSKDDSSGDSEPDESKPDDSEPDSEPDDSSKPDDSSEPDNGSKPDDSSKSTKDPDTSKSDTSKPDTGKPDTSEPDIKIDLGSSGVKAADVSVEGLGSNVLLDNADCTMKITEIKEKGSYGGYSIMVECVNKTSDKTLNFEWNDCSVNNYALNPFFSVSLKPGEKKETDATFFGSDFKELSIEKPALIKGEFRVFDPANFFDNIYEGSFSVFPYGKTSSIPKTYKADGKKVIDKNGILMYVIEGRSDKTFGYTLVNYIENNTDKAVHIMYNNMKVNGKEVSGLTSTSRLTSGQLAISNINWITKKLEEAGITEVNSVEFDIEFADYDNRTDVIASEHVTLNF